MTSLNAATLIPTSVNVGCFRQQQLVKAIGSKASLITTQNISTRGISQEGLLISSKLAQCQPALLFCLDLCFDALCIKRQVSVGSGFKSACHN